MCHELCKNGRTDQDAVWFLDLGRYKKYVLDGGAHWHHLVNTIEPSMCGGDAAFFSNYVDHLLTSEA